MANMNISVLRLVKRMFRRVFLARPYFQIKDIFEGTILRVNLMRPDHKKTKVKKKLSVHT